MQALKQATLDYFASLKYEVIEHSADSYLVKQKRTGLEVELDFSVLGRGELPQDNPPARDKRLAFLDVSDVETIGFDALGAFGEKLDQHFSVVIFDGEFSEQTMKEVWMFLSQDPRERDVFNDSRFYKP